MTFLIFFIAVFLLFVVHNCRNEKINVTNITKKNCFYKHFLIYNPKLCINQAIKVNKGHYK